MFTPQEIQEKTFVKAVFGGYDMQTVDDFLEPLTEDYITLYKENSVLKSKMKVLVEKLEEYRGQEESMKKALVAAQKTCDAMVAEAEKKCAKLLGDAEGSLKGRTEDLQRALQDEEQRVENAKLLALNFIDVVEKDIAKHLDLLKSLKQMDLSSKTAKHTIYDFERDTLERPTKTYSAPEKPAVQPADLLADEEAQSIASEIAENVGKIVGAETTGAEAKVRASHPDSATIKFSDLQFGKNYDPNK